MAAIWSWEVTESDAAAGDRADKLLHRAIESGLGNWTPGRGGDAAEPVQTSRSQIQRLIEEGAATVNGAAIRTSAKLSAGDRVRVTFPEPRKLEVAAEDRPIDVLYEDEHLLVLNKPPELTVHPSATQAEGTLVNALLHHVKDLSGIGGVLRPGIVHRIDKDTSGALVITKTDAAHRKLVEVFAAHAIERRYWALCYGVAPSERTIESLIGRNPADRKKMSMTVSTGRRAVTHVRRLEHYGGFASLVEAKLETGRTHQVRVHLTGIGHSLLGDPAYGTPSSRQPKWLALPAEVREAVEMLPGQALHARVLGFEHPVTGKPLRFEAEPPEGFRLLLQRLRKYQGTG